jgi:hypothetical protein
MDSKAELSHPVSDIRIDNEDAKVQALRNANEKKESPTDKQDSSTCMQCLIL